MGKNVLILAIIAVAGYLVGVEAGKRRDKNYEDLRHQVERLLTSNDAKKARKKMAKKVQKSIDDTRKALVGN